MTLARILSFYFTDTIHVYRRSRTPRANHEGALHLFVLSPEAELRAYP
jgi:hypothetical protein